MKKEKGFGKWLLKSSSIPIVIVLILAMIIGVVYICFQRINKQFCEERLRTLEAISSKITISTYTRFDVQWTSLNYSVKILQAMETGSANNLFDELHTIEESLGLSNGDGMLYLFDENGYYYGNKGKIGLWDDLKILQAKQEYSLLATNLPKQATQPGNFILFFYRFKSPRTMDGIPVTHVALARAISVLDDNLEIGDYGDIDSSYIIRKNGTQIYHQSNNEIFVNVYNVLKVLDECQFKHGVTQDTIKQDLQQDKSRAVHMVYKGEDYILAYQPLGIGDWYAVYLVSLHSMNQNTREFILQTVWIIGGASIALLVLCILLIHINSYRWRLKQRSINEQLRTAVEEAKRASRAKSEFLSRMSHDIRTPLNGIVGMTEIANRNIDKPDKVRDCLQKIVSSSDHLLSLINNVLDMSRIESGKLKIRCEPFHLKQVLNECTCMIEGQVAEYTLTFQCDYTGIVHNAVCGDKNRLKQILINILGNAVKFTPDGGTITFCVTETAGNDASQLYRFDISDTGIGMNEDYLAHIFEPFSQETSGPRTDYKGTGLGMSIVKKLVEQMKGEIQVESQKNAGSRFVILLPLTPVAEESAPEEATSEPPICRTTQGKILIAEDGVLNREIAEYLLADAGLAFVSVENGQQAVDAFCASKPGEFAAILMDMMMPVMDGLQATRILRALDRPDAQTIPIIAMTANAYREDEEKAKAAGINAYLTKPLHPDSLLTVIKELVEYKEAN